MTPDNDSRLLYRDTLTWVRDLAAHVPLQRLDDPTPCPGWDVRTLLGHLVATVDRARVIGEGGDPMVLPLVVDGVADDGWADAVAAARDRTLAVWSDDARLDATVTVPWGRVPGRAALMGYLQESLVHGWDLAVATGQPAEADPAAATAVLEQARRMIPAEPRGGPIPFAAPVTPQPEAGPTEQLANWCGHARR